ncbi:MAG: hypothetical protein AB7S26_23885 [Sandaracinaceae bacterium]
MRAEPLVPWTLALSIALVAIGCGGSGTESVEDARRAAAEENGGCGLGATQLGGHCWTAANTRWNIDASGPGGDYRFGVTLLAAGRVRAGDHPGAGPAHDEWFQVGPTLRIFLSDRFVEYRAQVTNGTVLIGEALNVRGQRWSWRGDRVFEEASCEPGDARLDDGCLALVGTRWELLRHDADAELIEFQEDGRLFHGEDDLVGRWEQAGSALTFRLAEEGPEYVALIASSDELSGSGPDNVAFTATRVPSIPPVMHE